MDRSFKLDMQEFGTLANGQKVTQFRITNPNGLEMRLIDYGCLMTNLLVPDRSGKLVDVLLGFDRLEDYVKDSPYFGAVIGRYGNRIAGGQFSLDGTTYSLPQNDGPNTLHGGVKGFDKVMWQAAPITDSTAYGVAFSYESPDGEEGFPGTLTARVRITLNDQNEVTLDYTAVTDKPTVINLTQHNYYNLDGMGTCLDQVMTIYADQYTPVDSTLIPTGERAPVAQTPFDFRTGKPIGKDIGADNRQLAYGRGFDHNFVLNKQAPGLLSLAAEVYSTKTGITMDVLTEEPGIQFYSGNFLDGSLKGKGGLVCEHRGAFCLETQHFPDSPNHPEFPSTRLNPGDIYQTRTVYRFGRKD
ncbi:MAG: aldose epimerase family protein [Saprospiraceae bacterium]